MSKEKKIYWFTAIMSTVIVAVALFIPGEPNKRSDLPWNIDHPTPDTLTVFDLTLGKSTTNQAEQRFQEEPTPSLFKTKDGKLEVEMFFDEVNLAGLKSKIVLTVDVPPEELSGMFDRGLRMSGTGSGKKITLTPEDVAKVRSYPIKDITYMPAVRVEKEIFQKRFGSPEQQIKEKESGVIHWIYPKAGLDIAFKDGEKAVLQYISPKDFNQLLEPLIKNGEVLSNTKI